MDEFRNSSSLITPLIVMFVDALFTSEAQITDYYFLRDLNRHVHASLADGINMLTYFLLLHAAVSLEAHVN